MGHERRPRSRGFTLLEGLFSLFIVFLVLAGLSQTLSQAAQVKSNTKNMDQAIEELHALSVMKNDLHSALALASPGAGSTTSRLSLTRVNPDFFFADRIDELSGDPLNPFEPSEQMEVEYRIEDGLLKRFVTKGSQPPTAERLLRAQNLQVSRIGGFPSLVTVSLTVKGTRFTRSRTIKVSVR